MFKRNLFKSRIKNIETVFTMNKLNVNIERIEEIFVKNFFKSNPHEFLSEKTQYTEIINQYLKSPNEETQKILYLCDKLTFTELLIEINFYDLDFLTFLLERFHKLTSLQIDKEDSSLPVLRKDSQLNTLYLDSLKSYLKDAININKKRLTDAGSLWVSKSAQFEDVQKELVGIGISNDKIFHVDEEFKIKNTLTKDMIIELIYNYSTHKFIDKRIPFGTNELFKEFLDLITTESISHNFKVIDSVFELDEFIDNYESKFDTNFKNMMCKFLKLDNSLTIKEQLRPQMNLKWYDVVSRYKSAVSELNLLFSDYFGLDVFDLIANGNHLIYQNRREKPIYVFGLYISMLKNRKIEDKLTSSPLIFIEKPLVIDYLMVSPTGCKNHFLFNLFVSKNLKVDDNLLAPLLEYSHFIISHSLYDSSTIFKGSLFNLLMSSNKAIGIKRP